jgi:hypothetical protein
MNKINNPIVSLFDKNFQLSKEELTTGSIESHIEDVKQNLLNNIKKGVSDSTNSNKNLKSGFVQTDTPVAPEAPEVQPNNGCAGLKYDIGIPPTKEILKTYDFEFSTTTSFDFSGSIPEIKVNDLPEGVKLLDYVPVHNPECEVLGDGKILFAGLPCGVPELIMCKKVLSKKVCGKRIYLGEVRYPCGYKQKTIHSVVLEPDDTEPSVIFVIPKTGFRMKGSIFLKTGFTAELYTNAPLGTLTDAIKNYDRPTYDKTTSNGTKPFKNTDDAIRRVLEIQDLGWIMKLVRSAATTLAGLSFTFTITSIRLSYRIDFDSISAYYDSHTVQATKLSYEQNNFEILKNGDYIALTLNSKLELSVILDLGTYQLGDFLAQNVVGLSELIKKCVQSELVKLDPTKTVRFNELNSVMSWFRDFNPALKYIMNNINIGIDFSLKLCSSFRVNNVEILCCQTTHFAFDDIIEFIKEDLINGIVAFLSISTYADLIHLDNLAFLPQDVTNKCKEINKKIDYVNNLYIKYVESAADATVKFLDKIPTNDFPLAKNITVCVPIFPVTI